ncbi:hypothetical protein scyTo_0002872 [Scyliorhinus torazame]|uniref:Neurofascin n=1 Tax=Scyliorhinus torazame TaxID=75743 RepID=A0A401PKY7_SCYTO|nr:hypothetical protein [Scyliorhinus torazame]
MLLRERIFLHTGLVCILSLCHRIASIEVPLDLAQPPTITKQSPKDYIVDPRDNVVIYCEGKGNPTPAFSWTRNGKFFNVAKDPRVSMRSRSGTLTMDFRYSGRAEDYEGEYQCSARNDHGTALSHKIVLRVSKAPLWRKEILEPFVVQEGAPLILPCQPPAGLPPPVIFWMDSLMESIPQDKRVSQGLNGDLYFSNVVRGDARFDYICNARFLFTHTIQQKNPITIRVMTTSPYWLNEPQNLVLAPGEYGRLMCQAYGNPKPDIQWLVNGEPIEKVRQSPSLEIHGDTIIFREAQIGSSAVYQCNASNEHGYLLANAFVSILDVQPRILSRRNQIVKVIENNRTKLECRYFGSPIPTLRWFKDGQGNNLYGGNYIIKDNGTLELRRTRKADEGTYTCIATNTLGKAENRVRLEVKDPTRIIRAPESTTVKRSLAAKFECKVRHDPTLRLTVTWLKDDRILSLPWRMKKDDDSLTIINVSERDEGIYTCVASTELDSDSAKARLTVLAPEINPADVRGAGISRSSMEIKWTPLNGTQISGPNLKYIVSWRQRDVRGEWSTVTVTRPSYVVSPTPFFTSYEIKVQAINDFGAGPEPRIIIGYSGEDYPIAAPTSISGRIVNSTAILLQWRSLPPDTIQGYLIGYRIQYWNEGSLLKASRFRSRVKVMESPGQRPRAIVSGMHPYNAYKLQVAAVNGRGRGPWSEEFAINTTEGVPGKPGSLWIRQPDLESITLQWTPPRDPNGIITGYAILYHPLTGSRARRNSTIPRLGHDVTTYKLERVDANTRYRFYVFAQTRQGLGEAIVLDSPDFENEVCVRVNEHACTHTHWVLAIMQELAAICPVLKDKFGEIKEEFGAEACRNLPAE